MSQHLFRALALLAVAMFAAAPFLVAQAPYESTMGLVQKIFYVHVPSAMVMFLSVFVCGVASAVYLFRSKPAADHLAVAAAELAAVFGALVLVTGPLWGRKSWGVWWQWDVRLTSSLILWLIVLSYLLLRRYGGPGSERLSAVLAIFGMANVPFVYWSVNVWRTIHPKTTVVPTLGPGMREAFWWYALAFVTLYGLMLTIRARLERQRAELDRLYLELDDDAA